MMAHNNRETCFFIFLYIFSHKSSSFINNMTFTDQTAHNLLQNTQRRQQSVINRYQQNAPFEVNLQGEECPCPIIDQLIECGDNDAFKTLTQFTEEEFNMIWSLFEAQIQAHWVKGRGKSCSISPRDALFITLVVLKTPTSWRSYARDFGVSASTLEKTVWKMMKIVGPLFKEEFCSSCTMRGLGKLDYVIYI